MRKSTSTVIVAALLGLAPVPSSFVERWYSSGFYTLLQPLLTSSSNRVPLALGDLAGCAVIVALVGLAWRDIRRFGWPRGAVRLAARVVVWAAALYVVFLAAWGFNYRRLPMTERLAYERAAVSAESASRLAEATVDQLNALHATAHAVGWHEPTIDADLAAAFERASRDLGVRSRIVEGRPKRSLLDWYFQRAGVSGMTDPFFLETLVASDLLPFERPFVIAHEWSHLAGLADEGEANLAGWLTCVRGTTPQQYSGWLFMYGEAIRAVTARERTALTGRLAAGPRADLAAIDVRLARQVNPRLSAAGWRVYDTYLKANRVEAGTASYDEVIRLALGLRVAQVF